MRAMAWVISPASTDLMLSPIRNGAASSAASGRVLSNINDIPKTPMMFNSTRPPRKAPTTAAGRIGARQRSTIHPETKAAIGKPMI